MRPKKAILLYCADDDLRSELAFLLRTCGPYLVMGGVFEYSPMPDVAVVIDDRSLATAVMATRIAELLPEVPLLVRLAPGRKVLPPKYPGNSQIVPWPKVPTGAEHANLLARVRVLAMRKRGPKKGCGQEQPQLRMATA